MRVKTLKQINGQTSRILCAITKTPLTPTDQIARMQRVRKIANKYRCNIIDHLKKKLSPAEMDEYFAVTEVPASIYTK